MNHSVPDFEIDDDYSSPPSAVLTRPRKSAMVEEDVMELLWQNGQVVLQSQNQRSLKKQSQSRVDDAVIPADHQSAPREIVSPPHHHHHRQNQDHFFMQEDEMASWLHYPLNDTNFDSDFCADLLYPSATCVTSTSTAPTATTTTTTPIHTAQVTESRPLNTAVSASASASRPPIPPLRRTDNFTHFSRHKPRATEISGPSNSKSLVVRESTVVNSSDTPAFAPESRLSEAMRSTEGASGGNISGGVAATSSAGGGGATDLATCEMTVTSSTGGSSASEEPAHKPAAEDRKRKRREAADDEYNYNSEDVELEFADVKKQNRGSTSTKRSRAAEVHNLSERRRRDRINEKMKALQELIPRCNKSDKASMLDEAIEYLKSLQLQVQMMSMGCGMVPMMFPGIQQYIPNMGVAMGMGMGMGMEMGMNRPMMPFPNIVAGSPLSTPAATAHLGPPRFPMPAYMQPVPPPDSSRVQANNNQPDPMLNSFGMQNQNPNQPRVANFVDPYQQYLALHQMQLPVVQNQSMAQASSSKLSTRKGPVNPENHPSG